MSISKNRIRFIVYLLFMIIGRYLQRLVDFQRGEAASELDQGCATVVGYAGLDFVTGLHTRKFVMIVFHPYGGCADQSHRNIAVLRFGN